MKGIPKNTFFLLVLSSFFLLSCKQPKTSGEVAKDLMFQVEHSYINLNPPTLRMISTQSLLVMMGKDIALPITVENSNGDKASATFNEGDHLLTVMAHEEGITKITLVDANGVRSSSINVTVSSLDLELNLDSSLIEIKVSKNAVLTITAGADIDVAALQLSYDASVIDAAHSAKTITLKGVGKGGTTLTITDVKSNITAQATIMVADLEQGITISSSSSSLKEGLEATFNVETGVDFEGSLLVRSSDSSVATAGLAGQVVTVKGIKSSATPVNIEIYQEGNDANKAVLKLTVTSLDVALTINPTISDIKVGASTTLTIEQGVDVGNLELTTDNSNATASLSPDQKTITVKGNTGGQTVVTITDSARPSTSAQATINVAALDLTLAIAQSPNQVEINKTISLAVTQGADIGTVSVNSSDSNVATATINGQTVTVEGLKSGTTTITVSANGQSDTTTIKVVDNSLSIAQSPSQVEINKTISLAVTQGADIGTVSVNSSDSNVATATINGQTVTVEGLKSGTTTITVSANGQSDTTTIKVVDNSLSIAQSPNQVEIKKSINLAVTQGADIGTVTVVSSDSNVATATINGQTVTVEGLKSGTTTITVSANGQSDTTTIKVVDNSLSIAQSPNQVEINKTISLAVTQGADIGTVSVNSSDSNVATATINGQTVTVEGLKSGTTTITVSANGQSDTTTIKVVDNSLSIPDKILLRSTDDQAHITVTKGADVSKATLVVKGIDKKIATANIEADGRIKIQAKERGETSFYVATTDGLHRSEIMEVSVQSLAIEMNPIKITMYVGEEDIVILSAGEDVKTIRLSLEDDSATYIQPTVALTGKQSYTISIKAKEEGQAKFSTIVNGEIDPDSYCEITVLPAKSR